MDKNLNILLITNEFPALTETFITTKALELARRGHKITILKSHENGQVNTSHLQLVKQAGIEIISGLKPSSTKDLLKLLLRQPLLVLKSISASREAFASRINSQLQQSLLKSKFDILHFEFSGLAINYMGLIEKVQKGTVVSCRGTAEKVKPLTVYGRKEKLRKLFTSVASIHCVSVDMAETIKPLVPDLSKIFVNRPSIDPNVFKRTRPYHRNTEFQILTIGRFTFQKGYLIGLMAAKRLKEAGLVFKWIIVGDGPMKEEIVFHIHTLDLQDFVELVGKKNRDEILDLYNAVDAFMLPSFYEGIANVCLEAMSMEIPLVSTKSGGMEEVIVQDKNGLLCDLYSPESLAVAIERLYCDMDLCDVLRKNGRQTIVDHFTIEEQVNCFEKNILSWSPNKFYHRYL